jgi:hypothetical protein
MNPLNLRKGHFKNTCTRWTAFGWAFLSVSLFTTSSAQAVLVEIGMLREVTAHIRPDTLVILDLDNTVIEPHQTLGSDEWFGASVQRLRAEGKTSEEAEHLAGQNWREVQLHAPMKFVEPETLGWIQKVQAAGNRVLGLTARPNTLAVRTIEQLREIGVNFLATPITPENIALDPAAGLVYHEGIIFSGHPIPKGTALLQFLVTVKHRPTHVIFVDDREHHAKSVEKSLIEAGIEHIVFRYGHNDSKAATYRSGGAAIAEVQWDVFKASLKASESSGSPKLLSDGDAQKKLKVE